MLHSLGPHFIFHDLRSFNLGENFVSWIQTLYASSEACVIHNGMSLGWFPVWGVCSWENSIWEGKTEWEEKKGKVWVSAKTTISRNHSVHEENVVLGRPSQDTANQEQFKRAGKNRAKQHVNHWQQRGNDKTPTQYVTCGVEFHCPIKNMWKPLNMQVHYKHDSMVCDL